MAIEILGAGILTTVQDRGRKGSAALGFQENGACDKYAMDVANILCGNGWMPPGKDAPSAAVLEFTLKGGTLRFTGREVIALAGADMQPKLNGAPVDMYRAVATEPGDVLELGMAVSGLRSYLAVCGGIDVPKVLGSRSTSLKCGLGGFHGRSLQPGDVLECGSAECRGGGQCGGAVRGGGTVPDAVAIRPGPEAVGRQVREDPWRRRIPPQEPWLCRTQTRRRFCGREQGMVLRVVAGPQEEAFTQAGRLALTAKPYRLTKDCDRMACRLEGTVLETVDGSDILSDGIVEGSVQVPPNGQPMVMMADHQTTGGYAKIATVIGADLPALAQLRPGETVRFCYVTPQEAVEAYREEMEKLRQLDRRING